MFDPMHASTPLRIVRVAASCLILVAMSVSEASVAGADAPNYMLGITANLAPGQDNAILPGKPFEAEVKITNTGTDASPATKLSNYFDMGPDPIQPTPRMWPAYTLTFTDSTGTYLPGSCDGGDGGTHGATVTDCDVPSVPAGSYLTAHLWFGGFENAPIIFTNINPPVRQVRAEQGQTLNAFFSLALPDGDDSVLQCPDACTSELDTSIGYFPVYKASVTSTDPDGTVTIPGGTRHYTVTIANDGTVDGTNWSAGFGDFTDGLGGVPPWPTEMAMPEFVTAINGLVIATTPYYTPVNIPGTPCYVTRGTTRYSTNVSCNSWDNNGGGPDNHPITAGEQTSFPFDLTFSATDSPDANTSLGTFDNAPIFAMNADTSNCSYGMDAWPSQDIDDDCKTTMPYSLAATPTIALDSVTPSPSTVAPGSEINWSIQYHNLSVYAPLVGSGNEIVVPIAGNQVLKSVTPGWSCEEWDFDSESSSFMCSPADTFSLPAGETNTLVVTTTTASDATGVTWLGAWDTSAGVIGEDGLPYCVSSAPPSTPDANGLPGWLSDCGLYATADFDVDPNLTISKTSSKPSVSPGESFDWTIAVSNNGMGPATGVHVTDTLPVGVTPTGTTPAGCTLTGSDLDCTPGTLAVGATRSYTVSVTADDPVPASVLQSGHVTNTAYVTDTTDSCPVGAPCSSTSIVDITPHADLSIAKTSSASSVSPGDSFDWTITVTNNGQGDDHDVVITDPLPEGTTASTAPAGCTLAGQDVTCNIGDLASGESVSKTLTVTADDPPPASVLQSGHVVNTAHVTDSNGNCPVGSTNAECESTSIVDITPHIPTPAHLRVTKTASVGTVRPGETFTWTVTVANVSDVADTGVRVTDTLPEGVVPTGTTSDGCRVDGQVFTCGIGDLASGATVEMSVTVRVTDPLPADVADAAVLKNVARGIDKGGNCPADTHGEPVDPDCLGTSTVDLVVPEPPTTTPPTSTVPPTSTTPTTQPPSLPPITVTPPSAPADTPPTSLPATGSHVSPLVALAAVIMFIGAMALGTSILNDRRRNDED